MLEIHFNHLQKIFECIVWDVFSSFLCAFTHTGHRFK